MTDDEPYDVDSLTDELAEKHYGFKQFSPREVVVYLCDRSSQDGGVLEATATSHGFRTACPRSTDGGEFAFKVTLVPGNHYTPQGYEVTFDE